MSDEQPDEEPTGLSALLNRHVPANPGKPRPWTPSEPARYGTEGYGTEGQGAEGYGTEGQGAEPDPSEGEDRVAQGPAEARPSAPAPPAWPEGTGDLSAVLADVGRLTSSMHGRLAELHGAIESAKDQTYEATAADESVVVEVNGRPRVTRVSIDAKALRGGPEALGAWVVEAVNAATSKARAGAQTALLDGLDPEMRAAVAAGIAEATGDGTSEGKGGRP